MSRNNPTKPHPMTKNIRLVALLALSPLAIVSAKEPVAPAAPAKVANPAQAKAPVAVAAKTPDKEASFPVSSEYELRGLFGTKPNYQVSVGKVGDPKSAWLGKGDKSGDLELRSIHPEKHYAVFLIRGKATRVNFGAAKQGEAVAATPAADTATPAPEVPKPVQQPGVVFSGTAVMSGSAIPGGGAVMIMGGAANEEKASPEKK